MPRLSDFDVLTFDCYGTLIDWESGLCAALEPWLAGHGVRRGRDEVLETFARHESAQERATPGRLYQGIVADVHRRLGEEWELESSAADAAAFGASVPDWPAFPDSVEALATLHRYYRLVILSNVDRASFRGSEKRLGVAFDAVYTAEDIGSYKPDRRNFEYLLRELERQGVLPERILHTAQSLHHDHVPASRLGLATAWIDRRHRQEGWGATLAPGEEVEVTFRFTSMGEMAAARVAEAG